MLYFAIMISLLSVNLQVAAKSLWLCLGLTIGDPDDVLSTENAPPDQPQQAGPAQITAVQVKLPPFWPKDPQLWFAKIEAQITTRQITVSRTKFDHVVASLAPEYAAEVRDLLLNLPEDIPYEVLKTELTKCTSASEQRRLQQLLTAEKLGNCKPSQVLRRIQQLLGDKADLMHTTIMRELFLQRLTSNVRIVLTPSAAALKLDELAQLADRIVEASPTLMIAVNENPAAHLTAQVNDLTKWLLPHWPVLL